MEYLVFGRTEYAEPLALVRTIEAASTPTVDDLGVGDDWLELTLVPVEEVLWILRGGEPVGRGGDPRARASASEPEGGDPRATASASEPEGGDPQARGSAREPDGERREALA